MMTQALGLMVSGMGGIFVVITIIYISMKALTKFTEDKDNTGTK